eukprot:m.52495 g.52495  ORF g.52495 m.52495 type:complete len:177 (-) comp13077_c0_seq1:205-735(-)
MTDAAIGQRLRIETATGETIEGILYAFDHVTHSLVLQMTNTTRNSHPHVYDIRIIRETFVRSWSLLGPGGDLKAAPAPSHVNLQEQRKKEAKEIREAKRKITMIGSGVSEYAQNLFYALSKTMNCQWKNKDIVVMDAVLIREPYSTENCTTLPGVSDETLHRVRKVVEGESRKIVQ